MSDIITKILENVLGFLATGCLPAMLGLIFVIGILIKIISTNQLNKFARRIADKELEGSREE